MIDILYTHEQLVAEQGLNLYRKYLENVLNYSSEYVATKIGYRSSFEFAINSTKDGLVTYDIDENGNKKLTGLLLKTKVPFTKRHTLTLICGINLSKVNKLLKTSLRSIAFDYYYYFPINEEVQILFEQNGFTVNNILEKLYKQDLRVMELKYEPPSSGI